MRDNQEKIVFETDLALTGQALQIEDQINIQPEYAIYKKRGSNRYLEDSKGLTHQVN
jgi:hypothetical protein